MNKNIKEICDTVFCSIVVIVCIGAIVLMTLGASNPPVQPETGTLSIPGLNAGEYANVFTITEEKATVVKIDHNGVVIQYFTPSFTSCCVNHNGPCPNPPGSMRREYWEPRGNNLVLVRTVEGKYRPPTQSAWEFPDQEAAEKK